MRRWTCRVARSAGRAGQQSSRPHSARPQTRVRAGCAPRSRPLRLAGSGCAATRCCFMCFWRSFRRAAGSATVTTPGLESFSTRRVRAQQVRCGLRVVAVESYQACGRSNRLRVAGCGWGVLLPGACGCSKRLRGAGCGLWSPSIPGACGCSKRLRGAGCRLWSPSTRRVWVQQAVAGSGLGVRIAGWGLRVAGAYLRLCWLHAPSSHLLAPSLHFLPPWCAVRGRGVGGMRRPPLTHAGP
eukprot:352109-Chlamydomonas_euryale.AAC.2